MQGDRGDRAVALELARRRGDTDGDGEEDGDDDGQVNEDDVDLDACCGDLDGDGDGEDDEGDRFGVIGGRLEEVGTGDLVAGTVVAELEIDRQSAALEEITLL